MNSYDMELFTSLPHYRHIAYTVKYRVVYTVKSHFEALRCTQCALILYLDTPSVPDIALTVYPMLRIFV